MELYMVIFCLICSIILLIAAIIESVNIAIKSSKIHKERKEYEYIQTEYLREQLEKCDLSEEETMLVDICALANKDNSLPIEKAREIAHSLYLVGYRRLSDRDDEG